MPCDDFFYSTNRIENFQKLMEKIYVASMGGENHGRQYIKTYALRSNHSTDWMLVRQLRSLNEYSATLRRDDLRCADGTLSSYLEGLLQQNHC